jgi:hypothetical protein
LAGIGEPSAGDEYGGDADGEADQVIIEKVIARILNSALFNNQVSWVIG